MNKYQLVGAVLGSISVSALGVTQSELAELMGARASVSAKTAADFNNDFEALVKKRTAEGKAVKLDGFGTFKQGVAYQKTGRNPKNGEPITYTAYKMPKGRMPTMNKAAVIDDLASSGKYTKAQALKLLDTKMEVTATTIAKGNGVTDQGGLGQFRSTLHAARQGKDPNGNTYRTAAMVVPTFKASSASAGLKFTAGTGFKKAVSGIK